VAAYLQHRLATAAASEATDTQVFLPQAAKAIAAYSGGVPRLVNVLAHKCLMLAYGEGEHRVGVKYVKLAAADTYGVLHPRPWWQRWLVGGNMRSSGPVVKVRARAQPDGDLL
jgi:MSHA biogenesis protein MshM